MTSISAYVTGNSCHVLTGRHGSDALASLRRLPVSALPICILLGRLFGYLFVISSAAQHDARIHNDQLHALHAGRSSRVRSHL